jgi:hypothetical protein
VTDIPEPHRDLLDSEVGTVATIDPRGPVNMRG